MGWLLLIIAEKRYDIDVLNKKVVELGAGIGLVSMVTDIFGASQVIATDLQESMPNLELNIKYNNSLVTTKAYKWGEPIDKELSNVDLIFGSEIIYHPDSVRDLLKALVNLSEPKTNIYIIYKPRNLGEYEFFELTKNNYDLKFIEIEPFDDCSNLGYRLVHLKLKMNKINI